MATIGRRVHTLGENVFAERQYMKRTCLDQVHKLKNIKMIVLIFIEFEAGMSRDIHFGESVIIHLILLNLAQGIACN